MEDVPILKGLKIKKSGMGWGLGGGEREMGILGEGEGEREGWMGERKGGDRVGKFDD